MNKLLATAVILALLAFHAASAQTTQWIHQFGAPVISVAQAVSGDGLGSIYVSGVTDGLGDPSPSSGFLSKFDQSGALLWDHQFGDSDLDSAAGVSADKLGNVFVAGQSPNIANDNTAISYVSLDKYDASGNLIWAHQFGEPAQATRVAADGLGNAYVAGYSAGPLFGPQNYGFLAKVDSAGNLLWGTQNTPNASVEGLSLDGDGNAYLSGANLVQKYSSSGSLIWTKVLGIANVISTHVAADALGNVFVTGTTFVPRGGQSNGQETYLLKYDPSGNLIWSQGFFNPGQTSARDIFADGLGNVYVTGGITPIFNGVNGNELDPYLYKYDSAGNRLWGRVLDGSGYNQASGVFADGAKGAYVVGSTTYLIDPTAMPGADAFIAKFGEVPEPTTAIQALSLFMGVFTMKRRRSFI